MKNKNIQSSYLFIDLYEIVRNILKRFTTQFRIRFKIFKSDNINIELLIFYNNAMPQTSTTRFAHHGVVYRVEFFDLKKHQGKIIKKIK